MTSGSTKAGTHHSDCGHESTLDTTHHSTTHRSSNSRTSSVGTNPPTRDASLRNAPFLHQLHQLRRQLLPRLDQLGQLPLRVLLVPATLLEAPVPQLSSTVPGLPRVMIPRHLTRATFSRPVPSATSRPAPTALQDPFAKRINGPNRLFL